MPHDKSDDQVRDELEKATGRREVDAVIECVGAEDTVRLAFALLATERAVASVGLVGNRVDMPLFPFVEREFSYFGSFWGNFNDNFVGRAVIVYDGRPPWQDRHPCRSLSP